MSAAIQFTPRVQRVLEFASDRARIAGRTETSVSDIPFGLLQLGSGVACNVLKKHSIDTAQLEAAILKTKTTQPYTVLLPAAQEEMRALHHTYLGTEHLLLALLHHSDNVLTIALKDRGVRIKDVRNEIRKELDPNFNPTD